MKTPIRSYYTLRQTVGWIGLLLPISLLIYSWISKGEPIPEPSVSLFYHTGMRDVFVGALCAVALFMFFYTGYSKCDSWTGNIAGLCAILTAFCYTEPLSATEMMWFNILHWVSAGLLFLCFIFFALVLFPIRVNGMVYRKGEKKGTYMVGALKETTKMKSRRTLYYTCGVGMFLCIAGIAVYAIVKTKQGESTRYSLLIFYLEALLLILFGVCWLVKGKAFFFKDREKDLQDIPVSDRPDYLDRPIEQEEFDRMLAQNKVLTHYSLLWGLIKCKNEELSDVC